MALMAALVSERWKKGTSATQIGQSLPHVTLLGWKHSFYGSHPQGLQFTNRLRSVVLEAMQWRCRPAQLEYHATVNFKLCRFVGSLICSENSFPFWWFTLYLKVFLAWSDGDSQAVSLRKGLVSFRPSAAGFVQRKSEAFCQWKHWVHMLCS